MYKLILCVECAFFPDFVELKPILRVYMFTSQFIDIF